MQYLFVPVISLVVAAAFIVIEKLGRYVEADVVKGVASAFFVLFGVLSAFRCNDPAFARMVVVGLVLGAIADVLLNLRYVFEGAKAQLAFMAGIAVFMLGHLAYIVACLPYCRFLVAAIVAGAVLTALLMYWVLGQVEAKLVLKVFGVFYIGAVVILNCVAFGALIITPSHHWLMFLAGTLLFLLSDVILILNNFGPRQLFGMRVANLMLYYVGQLLIAGSLQLPL